VEIEVVLMEGGKLDKRLTFQTNTPTVNSLGEYVDTYSDAFTVWAAIEPLTGSWLFQSMQANSKVNGQVRIRYRTDILPTMRIKFGSRYLKIISLIAPLEKGDELRVLYSEELD
jgi:SPP1 family predicted phage head-tail adaptor